jgi:hypothetical protein
MSSSTSPFDDLLQASRSLEARAQNVQGAEELLADETELASLADDYQAWLARALEILPTQFHEAFRFEYAGDLFRHRIKHFLQSPASAARFTKQTRTPSTFLPGVIRLRASSVPRSCSNARF